MGSCDKLSVLKSRGISSVLLAISATSIKWLDDSHFATRLASSRGKNLTIQSQQKQLDPLRHHNYIPARFRRRSQVAKATDCKSVTRGFNSHRRLSMVFSQKASFSPGKRGFFVSSPEFDAVAIETGDFG